MVRKMLDNSLFYQILFSDKIIFIYYTLNNCSSSDWAFSNIRRIFVTHFIVEAYGIDD